MHHVAARIPKRIHPASNERRGVVAALLLMTLVVLIGVGALALNWTWLTSHKVQLQRACEAAVLAGAAQLLDPTAGVTPPTPNVAAEARVAAAKEQARAFFTPNSNTILQTTGLNPDIVAGWCENPTQPNAAVTPWTGTGSVNTLSVRGVRRRSNGQGVTMWFGNFFGVSSAEPAASATASMDQRIYGFRPLEYVPVPMVPLMVPSNVQWPSGAVGTTSGMSDNYTVAPRTGAVSTGPDQVAEVTFYAPLTGGTTPPGQTAATWLRFPDLANNYDVLALQVRDGIEDVDLQGIGGEIALGIDGTYSIPAAAAPNVAQADQLVSTLLAIRGQKRIWPVGSLVAGDNQSTCRITGFVAGCVVNCTRNDSSLTIVVQGCTLQTCTGLLRTGMARNPWIGKVVLNQ
jgi:hypothetical protein